MWLSRPWSYTKKLHSWPSCSYITVHSYLVTYAYSYYCHITYYKYEKPYNSLLAYIITNFIK
jgi:hypothetical protein